jgi:hypothetical protein
MSEEKEQSARMRLIATTVAVLIVFAAPSAASAPGVGSANATVDLTAFRTRIADHPAFVRAVVDFTDGRMGANDSEATDADPFDGDAVIAIDHRRVQAQAPTVRTHGLKVRVTQGTNRIAARASAEARRFKYVERLQLRDPERLVMDFYKSRPPSPAAEIPRAPDGCLTLDDWAVRRGRIDASGEARSIFENQFQLVVRGADGRVKGRGSVTFGASGNWSRTVRYEIGHRQDGTLEAVDLSARDGTLACLAQVRVTLEP